VNAFRDTVQCLTDLLNADPANSRCCKDLIEGARVFYQEQLERYEKRLNRSRR
jgi:hypothetical protein